MFGLGPTELAIIAVIVALVFGVGRLPEVGGALGKTIREFKQSMNEDTTPDQTAQAAQAAQPVAAAPAPLPGGPETRDGAVRREEV